MMMMALRGISWLALLAPSAVVLAAPYAYITNQGSHDVSVVDLASDRVVATVPVGRSPAGVAVSSRTGRVFVSNADSQSISVIDMQRQQVVATWPGGSGPVGIATAADGAHLYVADWYANRLRVYEIRTDPFEPAAVATIAVGRAPAGVAVLGSGPTVFVAERDDDSVAVVDTLARRVRARVTVGSHPFALLHDDARRRVYALNVLSNDVSVIDVRKLDHPVVLATVVVGKAPYGAALAASGRLLYVTNQHDDTVSVIDAESLQVQRTLTGFGYPEGVAAFADKVYVVNWMDDTMSVLDAHSGRELATVATGRNSRGFGDFIGQPPARP
jgi:YVTN family beta-propeller protein